MNQLRDPLLRASAAPADDFGQAVRSTILSDFWPGIQLYYPPVKYAPALGIYEDLDAAAQRFRKHAHGTHAHTLILDLEDGCRQKEMSRELLQRELPGLPRQRALQVALRVNPFRTDEYEKDMQLIRDMSDVVDVVMLAKAGEAWFLGRRDDIIKSFGYRVSPYEVERVLKSHPAVADCACVGEERERDKRLVVAYVIPQPDSRVSPDELLAFGRDHLASYKAPKVVYLARELPRTKNGKILRREITPYLAVARSAS